MSTYLIVEDDALHRTFLREVIATSQIGCTNLIEAEDGDAAIRLARSNDVKGVIMDLQMPNKTGVQAARTMWAESPALPILFWSNYADEAYVRGITKIVPSSATYGYLLKNVVEGAPAPLDAMRISRRPEHRRSRDPRRAAAPQRAR